MSFSNRGREMTQASERGHLRLWILPEWGGRVPARPLPSHIYICSWTRWKRKRDVIDNWLMLTWGSMIYCCDSDRKSSLAKMIHAALTINLLPGCFYLNTRAPLIFMVLTGVSTYIENNSPSAVWGFLKLILCLFGRIWASGLNYSALLMQRISPICLVFFFSLEQKVSFWMNKSSFTRRELQDFWNRPLRDFLWCNPSHIFAMSVM